MPHIFDHEPSAQEVFDQACVFFATSEGPSAIPSTRNCAGYECVYRRDDGRVCVAGYFLPDESYDPDMDDPESSSDGSDVHALVKHYGDQIPSWFGQHVELLKQLQQIHDNEFHWTADHAWNYAELIRDLDVVADDNGLTKVAIDQVRAKGPKPEFTAADEQLLRALDQ